MAARRRQRNQSDPSGGLAIGPEALKGGSRTVIRVTGPVPRAPPRRQVHFSDTVETYEFEDDG